MEFIETNAMDQLIHRDQYAAMTTTIIDKKYYNIKSNTSIKNNIDENSLNSLVNNNSHRSLSKTDKLVIKNTKAILKWDKKFKCMPKSCQKASDYLLIFLYISIFLGHLTSAAPTIMDNGDTKLISVCNSTVVPSSNAGPLTTEDLKKIISAILSQCRSALDTAQHQVVEYIRIMWDDNLINHHTSWETRNEYWLYPEGKKLKEYNNKTLPKNVTDHVHSIDFLATGNLTTLLWDTYERFQRLSIGFSKIILDKEANSKYSERLDVIYGLLVKDMRTILCEVKSGINELTTEVRNEIDHNIIPETQSLNKLREWIIYREYINHLEYVVAVFEILQKRIENETSQNIPQNMKK